MNLAQTKKRVGSTHFQGQDGREMDNYLENGMRLKNYCSASKKKHLKKKYR
jgi:hypothetical protein